MTNITEQRESAFSEMNDAQSKLYTDPNLNAGLIDIFSSVLDRSNQSYTEFNLTVGDAILGLITPENLAGELARRLEMKMSDSENLAQKIFGFFTANGYEYTVDALPSETSNLQENRGGFKIQSIRTMETDAQALGQNVMNPDDDEPIVSGFSQDDLLKRE